MFTPAFAFEPLGEVSFRTRNGIFGGAAFDGSRIVGPTVDLARAEDGGWMGVIEGGHTQLWPTKDGVAGDAMLTEHGKIALHIERTKDSTDVRGLYFSAITRLSISAKGVTGRIGNCSIELNRKTPGVFEGDIGCTHKNATFPVVSRGTLRLIRGAAELDAPMPQLALALLSVFPR